MFTVSFILLALVGFYAFFKVDRSKSMVWMVANVAWLVGFGFLAFFKPAWYLDVGLAVAAVETIVSFASGVSPVSNFMGYVKAVFNNIFFYPVSVFEQVYGYLKSKV